jgi:heterodisulfide reductase subunit B
MDMALNKINSAKEAGAQYVCTACPYTHLQFDWVQKEMAANSGGWEPMAAILYPQLLGLSMGIDEQTLGLSENRLGLADITSYLISE